MGVFLKRRSNLIRIAILISLLSSSLIKSILRVYLIYNLEVVSCSPTLKRLLQDYRSRNALIPKYRSIRSMSSTALISIYRVRLIHSITSLVLKQWIQSRRHLWRNSSMDYMRRMKRNWLVQLKISFIWVSLGISSVISSRPIWCWLKYIVNSIRSRNHSLSTIS